ncbi:MAG: hypothetical protein U1E46_07910 [Hyphomicrobiales bacterium]
MNGTLILGQALVRYKCITVLPETAPMLRVRSTKSANNLLLAMAITLFVASAVPVLMIVAS